MPDRSWERGLHQLIEIKEGARSPRARRRRRASATSAFQRYLHLSGMTGTAREITGELWSIYGLPVVSIPTNRPLKRVYLGRGSMPRMGRSGRP
jgi:preprotein translocase subunit SecA